MKSKTLIFGDVDVDLVCKIPSVAEFAEYCAVITLRELKTKHVNMNRHTASTIKIPSKYWKYLDQKLGRKHSVDDRLEFIKAFRKIITWYVSGIN